MDRIEELSIADLLLEARHHDDADAVVQRVTSDDLTAIQIADRHHDVREVLAIHAAHQAAGYLGTLWLVDGSTAGIDDDSTWDTGHGTSEWCDGAMVRLLEGNAVDLIDACRQTPEYPCSVVLIAGDTVRAVRKAMVDVLDGEPVAIVGSLTEPVTVADLREWMRGPHRLIDDDNSAALHILDGLPVRRTQPFKHFYDVAVIGEKARVAFAHFNRDKQAEGVALGLTWRRTRTPVVFENGDVSEVGYLAGPATHAVLRWLEVRFGYESADLTRP